MTDWVSCKHVHKVCSMETASAAPRLPGVMESTGREAAPRAQQHRPGSGLSMGEMAGNNLPIHRALEQGTCRGEHSTWGKNCSGHGEDKRCEGRCGKQLLLLQLSAMVRNVNQGEKLVSHSGFNFASFRRRSWETVS